MTIARSGTGHEAATDDSGVDDSHVVDGVDVDALVVAVTGCLSVSGMTGGGALGGAVTLLPGRRVTGVRVVDDEVRVEVRARWGVTAATLAQEVRAATASLLGGHRLHVVIGDIDDPPGQVAPATQTVSAASQPAVLTAASEPTALPGAADTAALPADSFEPPASLS